MNKVKFLSEKLKEGLKEHVVMRDYVTLKAGGVADFYYEAKTVEQLVNAVKAALEVDLPYFILGNGSNVLFSDYGYPGLVIKNSTSNIAFMKEKSQVIVDSGVSLSRLILEATSNNFSGLEFLYGIPGTVGGAIYGDAGAFGQAIGDFVKSATLFFPEEYLNKTTENPDLESSSKIGIEQKQRQWLDFGYRVSKLKKIEGQKKPVILSVIIQLAQSRQEEIMRRLNLFKEKRIASQPIGQSAGCIFKNPIPEELKNFAGRASKNMPELPKERTAGFMLDKAGAKRLRVGAARVSSKHANFIVNTSNAKAQEIRQLVEKMRSAVMQKYAINLEEEIGYIGQW